MILNRPGPKDSGALISIEHLCMKFRTLIGICIVRCDQKMARNCYLQAYQKVGEKDLRINTIAHQAEEKTVKRLEPAVELEEIVLDLE